MYVSSWDEIVELVGERVKDAKPGEWIIGRGWHQEKWTKKLDEAVNGYPYHHKLSEISPNNPVLLGHVSGHSLYANKHAMDIASVSSETPDPFGGRIVRDANGEALGVFEERAMGIIRRHYQDYLQTIPEEQKYELWLKEHRLAENEVLKKGITSFQDAGSSFKTIARYKELAEKNELNVRLWAMVRAGVETLNENEGVLPIINAGDNFFTSRAIKTAIDGALGSFGAWLLKPYSDKENFYGQNTAKVTDVKDIAEYAINHDLQYCIHAIGDRANRLVLDIYEGTFGLHPEKEGLRWRIEHAQHIDTADIPRFAKLGIIASMQGIHCTSDAPYVNKRLGDFRAQYGSYPWRSLLDLGVIIANGTDAPVEDVDPIASYYASVTRKRIDNGMTFYPEQSMTREEALYSYTLGNAYAAFEEEIKGSLELGKLADLTILSKNLLTCSDDEIIETEVLYTIVGGKIKYQKTE
jgi:predicted amidohydrolase YtcJ